MKKITVKWLEKIDACSAGVEWMKSQKTTNPIELLKKGIASNDVEILLYCNWGICRYFNRVERIKYAVYAAKQVLHIYEDKYPEDDRPRKAIKAAEKCIKNNTRKNRNVADAYSYAYAPGAGAAAAYAAAAVAYANDTAYDTTYDTANAAAVAYAYAAAGVAAGAADERIKIKILRYGLRLLKARRTK